MYKVYNNENNEIIITKNKFSKLDMDKYARMVNIDLANGLRQFIEVDCTKEEFIQNFLRPLKRALSQKLDDRTKQVVESLKLVDCVSIPIAADGLTFWTVRALFTWDGDQRPLEDIVNAAHANINARDDRGKWVFNGGTDFASYSQADYLTIAAYPAISDNCTFRLYNDGYSDARDSEFFVGLKVDNKNGIYTDGSKSIISGPNVRLVIEDNFVENVMSTNYRTGKKPRIPVAYMLYFLFSQEGRKQEFEQLYTRLESQPFMKADVDLSDTENKTIEHIINAGMSIDAMNTDLSKFDGYERIYSLENNILAKDYGKYKSGQKITKTMEEDLLNSQNDVDIYCRLTERYYLMEPIKISLESVTGYILKGKVNKDNAIDTSTKYGRELKNYIIECELHDDCAIILEKTLLTNALQDILFANGIREISVAKRASANDFLKVSLTRKVLCKKTKANDFYNLLSIHKAILAKDKVAYYNVMNANLNYNKVVLTPEKLFKDFTIQSWAELLDNYKDRLLKRFSVTGNYDLTSLMKEYPEFSEERQNPLNIACGSVLRKLKYKLQVEHNYLEQLETSAMTNPINFLSSITKVDTAINSSKAISFESRMIVIPMLGRYDSFEVPPSHKIGATTHLTINSRIDREGNILARYYKVVNRQITNEVVELKIIDDHKHVITSLSEVDVDDNGRILNTEKILAKVQSVETYYGCDLDFVEPEKIDLISMSLIDELSWATASLLFIGNNDSARITYGCSQIKQAKSLINAEVPLVISPAWRLIPKVQEPFTNARANSGDYKFPIPRIFNSQHSVTTQYHNDEYQLDSKMYNKVSCSEIKKDCLAIGINALVAFYPDGSTYEDAVHMSKKMADRFISYRIESKESKPMKLPRETNFAQVEGNIQAPNAVDCTVLKQGDLMLRSLDLKTEAFYLNNDPALFLNRYLTREDAKGKDVTVTCTCDYLTISSLQAGDKVSNRHANKGVLSATSPEELPCLRRKTDNGLVDTDLQLDIVYNPFGVVARMNIGQLYEAQLGLIAKVLNTKFNVEVISNDVVKDLLKKTWKLVNSGNNFDSALSEFGLGPQFEERMRKIRPIIQSWKGMFDEQGRAYIQGSRTPVQIGYVYVNRLSQESETKINARGGRWDNASYSAINGTPKQGAKLEGGQRYGNMENDAIIAYGANKFLNKLVNERGNNLRASYIYAQDYMEAEVINGVETMTEEARSKTLAIAKELPDIRLSVAQLISYLLAMGIEVKSNTNNNTNYVLDIKRQSFQLGTLFKYGSKDKVGKGYSQSRFSDEELLAKFGNTHTARVNEILRKLTTDEFDYETKKNEKCPTGITWEALIEKWAYIVDNTEDYSKQPSIFDLIKDPTITKCDNLMKQYFETKKRVDSNTNKSDIVKEDYKKFSEPILDVDSNDTALVFEEGYDEAVFGITSED